MESFPSSMKGTTRSLHRRWCICQICLHVYRTRRVGMFLPSPAPLRNPPGAMRHRHFLPSPCGDNMIVNAFASPPPRLCSPNLSLSALEEDHRGVSGLSRLVRACLDGKLPEPRSRAFAAVQEALAKASAENVPKDKRGPVRAFLPTFRKLCSSSLCIG